MFIAGHARLGNDGLLRGFTGRQRSIYPDDVPLDEYPRVPWGTPLKPDPKNPRRAVVCEATIAARAVEARMGAALRLEAEGRDLAALATKGMPGAAAALAEVEAKQAVLIEAARAGA